MNIDRIIEHNRKCIAFGAVENKIVEFLLSKGVVIERFLDNDDKKWGKEIYGKKIASVESLNETEKENAFVIITTYSHWEEMTEQLLKNNVRNILIAQKDIDDYKSAYYQGFCQNIDLVNLKIDTLHLELSGYCNCKCIYCPFHGYANLKDGKKALMTWETLKETVSQMKAAKTIEILDVVGNGEIFVNKEWYEMVSYAISELGIKKLVMYTNGMLLSEENVKKIIALSVEKIHLEISIDGKTPEENDEYRKGSLYETIKENVLRAKELISSDKRIDMVITNCYMEEQTGEPGQLLGMLEMPTPQFLQRDFKNIVCVSKHTLGLEDYKIPGYKTQKVKWSEESLLCLDIFHRIAVDSRGKMIRCSCWNAGVSEIADVRKDNLVDIWYKDRLLNEAREHFRSRINKKDFCTGCPRRGMGEYYLLKKNNC